MNASFLVSPSPRGWFAASELAPRIETVVERLVRDGYSCRTAANHVDSIAHFARWMSRSRLKPIFYSAALKQPPFQQVTMLAIA